MISFERMQFIHDLVDEVGISEACKTTNLPRCTIIDYLSRFAGKSQGTTAKILLMDIETAPTKAYVWQLMRNNYIHINQIVRSDKDWNMICWRAKWLFDDTVMGDVLTPEEAIVGDDERIARTLWDQMDEADIIIGHNLDDFDRRKANSRFLIHGLLPPSSYQIIDTLKVARGQFSVLSNKLDYLCQILGIGAKLHTGFQLWRDCIGDNPIETTTINAGNYVSRCETFDLKTITNALQRMFIYCEQDTSILEDLYLRLRPWIKSHPNMALYFEDREGRCASCGGTNLRAGKPYYTPTGEYQSYRCWHCGSFTRSRHSVKREEDLLRSVAR